MGVTNILDLNNRIDALEKSFHELKIWTTAEAKSVSGNPIIITDGIARKAEGLVVTLEPKQSGRGTPSPTNVRPITGLTECVVDRDGKNKLSNDLDAIKAKNVAGTWVDNVYSYNGIKYTYNDDGTINIDGTLTGVVSTFCIPTNLTAGNYLANGMVLLGANTYMQYQEGSYWSGTVQSADDLPITSNGDSGTLYIYIRVNVSNATVKPMIRLASESDATFAPYSHDTATITFGQTVYGGSVDFKTGKVTVTHASIANYNGESINEPWLSSIDEYVSGTTPTTGAQVVYPLTTPIELTLTPAELELLKGYNYITTNGTTIALDYLPDSLKADILLTVSQLYGSKISIFDEILAGGDTGQVLTKTSNDNYDATWATLPTTRTTNKK